MSGMGFLHVIGSGWMVKWWTQQDLNLRPLACEASALTELSYASAAANDYRVRGAVPQGYRIEPPAPLAREDTDVAIAMDFAELDDLLFIRLGAGF